MASMVLGEFVELLTAKLHEKSVPMPFRNERAWHLLFYKLKELPEESNKPIFLEKLRFDWDGPYPESRELSEFLHALHWNASVSANNPHYDTITLPEDVASIWLKRVDELDKGTKEFLDIALNYAKDDFSSVIEME